MLMSSGLVYNWMPAYLFYPVSTIGFSSAFLSCFGSSTILYLILQHKRYKDSTFQCLMLGLSASDLVASIAFFCSPFAVPTSTGLPTAHGNGTSCRIFATLLIYAHTSFFYTAEISLYFLLTIRYGWSESRARQRLRWWVHILPWLFPAVTQVLAIYHDFYRADPLLAVCTIDCSIEVNGKCSRYMRVFEAVAVPAFFAAIAGIVCIWLVYRAVYRQESSSNRHSVGDFKQTKAVAQQAICYFIAGLNPIAISFLIAYDTHISGNLYTIAERPQVAGVIALIYLLSPIQGFLNWIIYCRPSYVRWRKLCPEHSRWWAYQQVLLNRPPLRTSLTPHKPGDDNNDNNDASYPRMRTDVTQQTMTTTSNRIPPESHGDDETSITDEFDDSFTPNSRLQQSSDLYDGEASLSLGDLESNDSLALEVAEPHDDDVCQLDRSLQIIMGWRDEAHDESEEEQEQPVRQLQRPFQSVQRPNSMRSFFRQPSTSTRRNFMSLGLDVSPSNLQQSSASTTFPTPIRE